jgi:hypothetical protein
MATRPLKAPRHKRSILYRGRRGMIGDGTVMGSVVLHSGGTFTWLAGETWVNRICARCEKQNVSAWQTKVTLAMCAHLRLSRL